MVNISNNTETFEIAYESFEKHKHDKKEIVDLDKCIQQNLQQQK